MKDQLTLEMLCGYLPYELKVLNNWGDIKKMRYTHLDDDGNGWIGGIKPIFRNLSSDLTREIEHNGERFVPIERLFGISRGAHHNNKFKNTSIMSPYQMQFEMLGSRDYYFSMQRDEGDVRLGLGWSFKTFSTDLRKDNRREENVLFNSLLFESLKKWHFWIYDQSYFKKGIILDINELK